MSRLDPAATFLEPLVGWRCWRVLPMQTLSNGKRYRLCASGIYGIPKVWEPREAVVALCSDFSSRHEAPHPSHECGLYAYAERELAERKFVALVRANGAPGVTWAFGRVSLWGRVIECELGWRAQFAYPYDVTVYTDGNVSEAVADQYAIDVSPASLAALRKLLRKQLPTPSSSQDPKVFDPGWYDRSIAGGTDRWFLRPYHQELCKRLDKIAASIERLDRDVSQIASEAENADV